MLKQKPIYSTYSQNTGTFGQDGGISKHGLSPHTTTTKITTKLQNNSHPESSENRPVWKSDKQGIKEVTFIYG